MYDCFQTVISIISLKSFSYIQIQPALWLKVLIYSKTNFFFFFSSPNLPLDYDSISGKPIAQLNETSPILYSQSWNNKIQNYNGLNLNKQLNYFWHNWKVQPFEKKKKKTTSYFKACKNIHPHQTEKRTDPQR